MWPFNRKPAPRRLNPGPINEDWAVGDLAECVEDGWKNSDTGASGTGPEKGDVSKVTDIEPARTTLDGDGWYLGLRGFSAGYNAEAFRKVPALNTEATAEFTASIRALKPKRVKA